MTTDFLINWCLSNTFRLYSRSWNWAWRGCFVGVPRFAFLLPVSNTLGILSWKLTTVNLAGCENPLSSWRRALHGCILPFPQVHAGGAGSGDASQGSAEGPRLANIQRPAGLWRWHLCLRHPFNTWEQTVMKAASRVFIGWGCLGEGPIRDNMVLVIWPGHFQLM